MVATTRIRDVEQEQCIQTLKQFRHSVQGLVTETEQYTSMLTRSQEGFSSNYRIGRDST